MIWTHFPGIHCPPYASENTRCMADGLKKEFASIKNIQDELDQQEREIQNTPLDVPVPSGTNLRLEGTNVLSRELEARQKLAGYFPLVAQDAAAEGKRLSVELADLEMTIQADLLNLGFTESIIERNIVGYHPDVQALRLRIQNIRGELRDLEVENDEAINWLKSQTGARRKAL